MSDWTIQIIDITGPGVVCDEKYTDKEILQLLTGSSSAEEVSELDAVGLSTEISIEGISDNTDFFKAFWDSYFDDDYAEIVKTDPSRGSSYGTKVEVGHPDFLVEYPDRFECECGWVSEREEDPNFCGNCSTKYRHPGASDSDIEDSKIVEVERREPTYVELKVNEDSLRNSQFKWIANNLNTGKKIWLMLVER